jgi:NADP-dependent 3-hydroxy acid dehydrogenase YdfG
LENKFNIAVFQLAFDVQDEKAVTEAIAQLPVEWKNIDVLVNNAGLALGRDFLKKPILRTGTP